MCLRRVTTYITLIYTCSVYYSLLRYICTSWIHDSYVTVTMYTLTGGLILYTNIMFVHHTIYVIVNTLQAGLYGI